MDKIFSKEELPSIAKEIIKRAGQNAERGSATVVALSGELGAGKTTLVQEIGRQMGVRESMVSPTFVLMKKYKIESSVHKALVHIDAYRLDSHHELLKLGWQELIEDPSNIVFIEWPERVPELIPESAQHITLEHTDESTRHIDIS